MDKAEKNYLIEKIPEEDDIQAFTSGTKGVKRTRESKDFGFSRSTIFSLVRLRLKTRSQEKEVLLSRITEIGRILVVVILKSLGNCKQRYWSLHHRSSQKRILVSSPTTKRMCVEKTWRIWVMAFQGQRCGHLIILLASHPLGCVP